MDLHCKSDQNIDFRKEIWIMDPSHDHYYRWLTIIAAPAFYNLMMLVTRYHFPLLFSALHLSIYQVSIVTPMGLSFSLFSRACFNELQNSYTTLWMSLDLISDIIYYMDTFVRSRTGPLLFRAAPLRSTEPKLRCI